MTDVRRLAGLDGLEELYADAPRVRAGFVLSADGATAYRGSSRPLSGPTDRAALRSLRAVAGAVVVGAGTARAEDYGPVPLPEPLRAWRIAAGLPERPPLVVVTRRGELDPASRLFAGPSRTTVLTCAAADTAALGGVADVVVAGQDEVDLTAGLAALGHERLLVEGGPALLGDLVRLGLVDELCLTLAPLLAGSPATGPGAGVLAGALPSTVPLTLRHVLEHEGVLLLRYGVGRPT